MSESRTLAGRRVVVTRPRSDDEPLAAALIRAGAQPVCLPLLRIERVAGMEMRPCDLEEYDRVIFTSANAVSSFAAGLGDAALARLREHPGIAVVGPATAKAVAAHGALSAIEASEHVAESLVIALGNVAGQRILWPRAEVVRPVLAANLLAGGASLTEIVVYRAVPCVPDDSVRAITDADAVTFTSPSGVRAWSSLFGKPAMRVICIGPVTARAAADSGFNVDAVAAPYTIAGVMSALHSAFASNSGSLS